MLIPIRTNAPIYHPPAITSVMICINVIFYFLTIGSLGWGESPARFTPLILEFGTINPSQWVTSFFMHGSFMHLFGNMIFLWTFGMIVEGKLGWWKFLILYMLMGTAGGAIEQLLMIWETAGGALGASGVIFSLIAITMLWAPMNDFTVVFFFIVRGFVFEMSISLFCFITIGWELFDQIMLVRTSDGTMSSLMSSALLHLIGAGVGFAAGHFLLVSRRVDCEGYDLYSVWKGEEGKQVLTLEQEAEKKRLAEEAAEERRIEKQKAKQFIQMYLDQGRVDLAISRFETLRSKAPSAIWDPRQLQQVINLLAKEEAWDKIMYYIDQMVSIAPQTIVPYRIMAAEIFITKLSRPRKGLRMIESIKAESKNDKQQNTINRLIAIAQKMIDDGLIEVGD